MPPFTITPPPLAAVAAMFGGGFVVLLFFPSRLLKKKKQLNVDKASEDGIVPSFPPPNQEVKFLGLILQFLHSFSCLGLLLGVSNFSVFSLCVTLSDGRL